MKEEIEKEFESLRQRQYQERQDFLKKKANKIPELLIEYEKEKKEMKGFGKEREGQVPLIDPYKKAEFKARWARLFNKLGLSEFTQEGWDIEAQRPSGMQDDVKDWAVELFLRGYNTDRQER